MGRTSAIKLIQDTFQHSFNEARFYKFVNNLLNHIELTPSTVYRGNLIPDAYKPYIQTLDRLGKYKDPEEKKIDILIVHLKKDTSLERARTMQRNFIAWYLNGSRGGVLKDAALVAFVSPEQDDWRFSFIKMEYRLDKTPEGKIKAKEEFTPAKRYSFLVGKNEDSHTAKISLIPLLINDDNDPLLAELEDAFSIEKVTKEFFLKYRELFLRTKEELDRVVNKDLKIKEDFDEKGVDTVNFAKKLLGQIVFLYFLQKKGWFGVGRDDDWGTGSKHFLRELFKENHSDYENFYNDILEPLFYEALRIDRSHDDGYYSRFDCKIPFLNGGLFDPIGNYDWVHTDIIIPDKLFSNTRKTKEGDTGDGILDIFDRFNFTVKEDEPLEKEVAIDPELLGKAYEKFNAIRPDNYDEFRKALKSGKTGEENKFNKKFGVYYTPREIVHYMCQQSLINYLHTELVGVESIPPVKKEDLETLIHTGEQVSENEIAALIKEQNIKEGKQKTSGYKLQLSESIRSNAALIDEKLADITVCDPAVGSGAFPVGMMSEIVRVRNVLSVFLNDNSRTAYEFKRRCIEHSLYGVDIDPGAVEIAKLRLWLSLVVDEDDIKNIKPLPNLDYKIVCGNSLLGVEKNLFNNELFNELERLKPLFFNETNPTKKQEYKKQIDNLISQITSGHKEFDFEVYFSEVFHNKGGFDVVIANPPYISHDKILINKKVLKTQFQSYEPFADIYCYFIETGIKLQNKKGLLCFITSNSYLRAEYGFSLRKLLRKENELLEIINLEEAQVFEDAIVNAAILLSSKGFANRECFLFNQLFLSNISHFSEYITAEGFMYSQKMFNSKSWSLLEPEKILIQRKLEKGNKTLEQLGAKIRLGLATGSNNAFIINENKKNEFIKLNPKNSKIIKPILRGRDIFRYHYDFQNLYILLTKNGVNVKKDYPDIYNYLDSFGESFKKRGAQGQHWTNLRAVAFFDDFKKENIVWIELTDVGRFALCIEDIYLLNSAYFLIPPQDINNKYLLGVLNSKLIYFYLGIIAETSGMGVSRWINNYVKEFPIVQVTDDKQAPIIKLVDTILAAKNSNPQADTAALEQKIDQLVYKLYDLTSEEIAIIEGGKK